MSLSEKYRPVKFQDMWQWPDSHVLKAITNDIQNEIHHPRMQIIAPFGVGKTTLARILGRRRCCENTGAHHFEPCGECKGCKSVDMSWSGGWSEWGYCESDCTTVTKEKLDKIMHYEIAFNPMQNPGARWLLCLDELSRSEKKLQHRLLKPVESETFDTILCLATENKKDILKELRKRFVPMVLDPPTPDQCSNALQRITEVEDIHLDNGLARLLVTRLGCVPRDILMALDYAWSLAGSNRLGKEEILVAIEAQAD